MALPVISGMAVAPLGTCSTFGRRRRYVHYHNNNKDTEQFQRQERGEVQNITNEFHIVPSVYCCSHFQNEACPSHSDVFGRSYSCGSVEPCDCDNLMEDATVHAIADRRAVSQQPLYANLRHNNTNRRSTAHKPTEICSMTSLGRTLTLTFLSLTLILSGFQHGPQGVAGLSCETCNPSQCLNMTSCPGGITLDVCGCCPMCSRVVNQSCGGPFGILGRCDSDLHCFVTHQNLHYMEGTCKDLRPAKCSETNNCPSSPSESLCPPDSYVVTNDKYHDENNNNNNKDYNDFSNAKPPLVPPPPPPSFISPFPATANHVGSGHGQDDFSSTNTYTTGDDDDDDGVDNKDNRDSSSYNINSLSPLSLDDASTLDDEEDDYLQTNTNDFDTYDSSSYMGGPEYVEFRETEYILTEMPAAYCVCNKSACPVPVCMEGYIPHLVHNASGYPGSCCNEYECKPFDKCQSQICPPLIEDQCPEGSHRPPPIWSDDHCCQVQQKCVCKPQSECEPVSCAPGFQIQVTLRATGIPGSCCDIFRCVNESGLTCHYKGKEKKNGDTWDIDMCKTCECKDGLNRCRSKSCEQSSCTWMVRPEGQCCHVCMGCVSESGDVYNESAVWRENNCTVCTCKNGHPQCQAEMCMTRCENPKYVPGQCCPQCPDEEEILEEPRLCPGIDLCDLSCSHGLEESFDGCFLCRCKPEPCDLDCPNGFQSDVEGRQLCRCRETTEFLPASVSSDCPLQEADCGKKCEYGLQRTLDGCVKCKCNKCPPQTLTCNKTCLHGFLTNDEGCQLCKCKEAPPASSLVYEPQQPVAVSVQAEGEGRPCMTLSGARYDDGESWDDGCRKCYCHMGREMCSLIACPSPPCNNPVFRVGDCCPTCPGIIEEISGDKERCESSNRYYVEGETWDLDACTSCVCHGGAILCQTSACPPLPCHSPVKHEKSCCAVCENNPLALPATPTFPRHCKSTTGIFYKHGEAWKPTPCQSCLCHNGQINCYSQMCPPVSCVHTISRKGECCPSCLETHQYPVCQYNGMIFKTGEEWQGDNCSQCVCVDGETKCFPLTCPVLDCAVMVLKKGHCCPVCYDLPAKVQEKSPSSGLTNISAEPSSSPSFTVDNDNGVNEDNNKANIIGFSVLGILVFLLAVAVVLLVAYILWWRRRNPPPRSPRFRPRPKSTNLELQGHIPFIPPDSSGGGGGGGGVDGSDLKGVSAEKQLLEKLCSGLVVERETRASNPYTEMRFGDHSKDNKKNNEHFLASVKT